jgi:hypothetical protein
MSIAYRAREVRQMDMKTAAGRKPEPDALRSARLTAALCCGVAMLFVLPACRPVRFAAHTNIPQPLLTPIPVTIGLYLPEEFKQYVHKEERWSVEWEIELGQAQTDGLTRLVNAMFAGVVELDSIMGAVANPEIRAVLEPQLEQYSFVTPRDAGAQFYAVSLKYRVGLYSPDGKLVESWPFTGYGSVESSGFGGEDPLRKATAIAMRDAGAKLAVEFRQQAMVRGLLPEAAMDEQLPGGLEPPRETEPSSLEDAQREPGEILPESPPGAGAAESEVLPAEDSAEAVVPNDQTGDTEDVQPLPAAEDSAGSTDLEDGSSEAQPGT